ncbi:ATP-binding protein [Actinomyces succiniciruminis]|uniref:Divergent AAA domain protein n=1 Tax=Actinomyces succiniciruminis TaxID=1522002 RepID=A0A1L7RKK9_9ACTO|nr:ATP-binding protein [Actinomyces succiniciruminis]CED91639.1 Divergent AAA domain protein [Actinomyces succiniciruminis]
MLTAAVEWVSQNARTNIELGEDGHARNVYEYPPVAVRELIANALVHRDLSEPALSKGVEIRLTRDRLIISSPGGLWGLTVDQLGTRDGKSAVNERLYDICTFTTDADGRRMIEGLGTGIRAVREALRQADMEPVRFQDTGVRFTALLPRAALLSPADLTWLADLDTEGLGVDQRHALAEMRHGRSWTNSTHRRRFGLDSAQARRQLQELVNLGLAETSGTKGSTSYALASAGGQADNPDNSGNSAQKDETRVPEEVAAVSTNAAVVWSCLGTTPKTRAQIAEATGLTDRQVKWALDRLKTASFVVFQGRQGSTATAYRRA